MKNKKVSHFTWEGIEVVLQDPLGENISLKSVLNRVSDSVPAHLRKEVDSIYVGNYDFLLKRGVNAVFENGAIFVTNEQSTEEDMVDDIIHEIAHSLEVKYGELLYGDRKLSEEFLSKRKELWFLLSEEGYSLDLEIYLNVKFDSTFDYYLNQQVGYPMLAIITPNLFFSPYAATSLREYFANGFEAVFYHRDSERLKKISPILFDKISQLMYNKNYEI